MQHDEHGRHAASVEPDAGSPDVTDAPARHRKKHARVRTDPVPGTDPNPAPEPPRSTGTENDARLKQDVPPHWG